MSLMDLFPNAKGWSQMSPLPFGDLLVNLQFLVAEGPAVRSHRRTYCLTLTSCSHSTWTVPCSFSLPNGRHKVSIQLEDDPTKGNFGFDTDSVDFMSDSDASPDSSDSSERLYIDELPDVEKGNPLR